MLLRRPTPRPPGARGRPRRHGAKFTCADPTTWPAPTATLVCQDDQYGSVTVAAWSGLHPKQQRHPGHGTRGPRPIVRGTILRVQVERVPARTRPPKVLWLWWAGPGSWTAPVDARRLHPLDDTDQTAAAQIHALLRRLGAGGPVPLFVFDAGYDSAQLTLDLAETRWRCWYDCGRTVAAPPTHPTPARR